MEAAFNFPEFLNIASELWKSQSSKEKYCIQNAFEHDKDIIDVGMKVVNWRDSSIERYIETIERCFKLPGSRLKSTSAAEDNRQKGNKLFQKKDYKQALEFYTKSVQIAPHDGSDTLAFAHANRSAALFHLGHYKACIQDIDEAIGQGYPTDKHYKVLQRKGQCFLKLGCFKEAQEEFLKALQCLECVVGESKRKQEVKTLLQESINPSVEDQLLSLRFKLSDESGEEISEISSRLANASTAVIAKYQKEKGRYLEATRDIEAGELLIKDKPYAAIILKEEENSYCHHCFVPCSPIPCPSCTYARYCSSECRAACLSQYHFVECGTEELLQQVSLFSQLSLRILITAGTKALSQHINNSKTPSCSQSSSKSSTSSSSTASQTPSSDYVERGKVTYESIHGLEAHWFNHSHEELIQYAVTSILLAKCFYSKLVLPETCETFSKDEIVTEMASLLLLHTRQLKSNSHAITHVRSSEKGNTTAKSTDGTIEEISQVRIATAVYPTVSLMNHACQPNVIASFRKDIISVRATERIRCGDEIQHCYGPQVGHMTSSDRQEALLKQYCFTCCCRACKSHPISSEKERDIRIKCPQCGHQLNFKTSMCGPCNVRFNLSILLRKSTGAITKISELVDEFSAVEGDKAVMRDVVSRTKCCIEELERIVMTPDMKLAEAYDFMAKCHAMLDEFKEAGSWLTKSIPTIEWKYGRDSIEVANELYKLAQIYFNGEEVAPAMEAIDRALELFSRHYGNNTCEVQDLMKMKLCLKLL
nr:SET and MYND domain-containing protein 4-like [Lytechinus pictus]